MQHASGLSGKGEAANEVEDSETRFIAELGVRMTRSQAQVQPRLALSARLKCPFQLITTSLVSETRELCTHVERCEAGHPPPV